MQQFELLINGRVVQPQVVAASGRDEEMVADYPQRSTPFHRVPGHEVGFRFIWKCRLPFITIQNRGQLLTIILSTPLRLSSFYANRVRVRPAIVIKL